MMLDVETMAGVEKPTHLSSHDIIQSPDRGT